MGGMDLPDEMIDALAHAEIEQAIESVFGPVSSEHPAAGREGTPGDSAGLFFFDKAHGVKMARIALWIVENGRPMSGKSVREAMSALGIDDLQDYNERQVHGIVSVLRSPSE